MMFSNCKGIIFGATGFIGNQIAHKLTRRGAKLILHGKSKEKLEKLDDDLKNKYDLRQILLQGDFTKENFFSDLSKIIHSRFDCLDFLMNFVGKFERLSPLTNLTTNEWEEMIQINVNSYWRILKELEPLLKRSVRPRVMFITTENFSNAKPYQNFFSISQVMKKIIGEIFYEENKRLKIITKVIQVPLLNNGISLKISSKNKIKNNDEIIERIIEKTFEDTNKEMLVRLS